MARKKIIDIYARLSRDNDGTTRSVDSQVDDCKDAIEERDGWEVGQAWRDHALSGWNKRVKRPDFEALMARLESGQADGLIVLDVTRFTRKPAEGERLLELAQRGVIVASIEGEYNLTSARGRRQFRDDLAQAAYESDRISERTTRGKRKRAGRLRMNATWRGFGQPGNVHQKPEGWMIGDPVPQVSHERVTAERDAVREVASRLLAGESLNQMCSELNQAGLLTVTDKPWDGRALRQLLRRPSLAGLVEYKGEIKGEAVGVEPVLDRATWEALQTLFDGRVRGGRPPIYLLSGIMRCGRCGRPLTGRPRYALKAYEDGAQRREYWCQPSPVGGCGRLAIDWRFADEVVRQATIERLTDPLMLASMQEKQARFSAAEANVRNEIAQARETERQLAERLGRGWNPDLYDAAHAGLEARLANLQEQLDSLAHDSHGTSVVGIAERWESVSLRRRRAWVKEAFPRLTCKPAELQTARGRRQVSRFDWDGSTLPESGSTAPVEPAGHR